MIKKKPTHYIYSVELLKGIQVYFNTYKEAYLYVQKILTREDYKPKEKDPYVKLLIKEVNNEAHN